MFLSRSSISKQGQRMRRPTECTAWQWWLHAERSKAEGENGLTDSASGRVSNRFWK